MRVDVLNHFIYGLAQIKVETCMVTYLIRDTWPDVNGNWLAVVGGINIFNCCQSQPHLKHLMKYIMLFLME